MHDALPKAAVEIPRSACGPLDFQFSKCQRAVDDGCGDIPERFVAASAVAARELGFVEVNARPGKEHPFGLLQQDSDVQSRLLATGLRLQPVDVGNHVAGVETVQARPRVALQLEELEVLGVVAGRRHYLEVAVLAAEDDPRCIRAQRLRDRPRR